ncbi:hypothetical protein KIPB_007891, partial [Kipferlia bialata]|eukprot:g7891.t1
MSMNGQHYAPQMPSMPSISVISQQIQHLMTKLGDDTIPPLQREHIDREINRLNGERLRMYTAAESRTRSDGHAQMKPVAATDLFRLPTASLLDHVSEGERTSSGLTLSAMAHDHDHA